ncbi:hypothetical protein EO244_13040 [Ancylomarina salipaludis]|uniref:Uncharacterized protein n=1 Tax=Ancylomarina salipaludis TaxID=2501299 RepID=A0A4Q1JKM3_9BACT|nr:hypothetical protein [Ancylomarina salipaludis]RXQ91023.1 hypothetical protein EO244_13040 [Ancylomarina salipaludis]
MRKNRFYIFILLLAYMSCSKENPVKKDIAFYHWKAKADFTKTYRQAIETTEANRVYMHYFDIEPLKKVNWYDDGIYPTYVLKSVAKDYQNLDIIPVVYIANPVFKTDDLDVSKLSKKISKLIDQISQKHFNRKIKRIQIDCDWTETTRASYFELLRKLKNDFTIDVTIRLHQIKFKERTGVPPVGTGTLMLYNMGDLKDKAQNSILESAIVGQYINAESTYPIKLKIALPLFSQTVVTNKTNKIKLIKNTHRSVLENDPHFKQINPTNFEVVRDTLYKGFYLAQGYHLKLEDVQQSELCASYELIKKSKLNTQGIIFYHLDDHSLLNYDLKNTIEKL